MRTYVIVTGIVFALLTLLHLGIIASKPELASDPALLVSTAISAGLAVWSWRVIRRARASGQT
jgi:hypothetical protein